MTSVSLFHAAVSHKADTVPDLQDSLSVHYGRMPGAMFTQKMLLYVMFRQHTMLCISYVASSQFGQAQKPCYILRQLSEWRRRGVSQHIPELHRCRRQDAPIRASMGSRTTPYLPVEYVCSTHPEPH
jgi:hypothetical protein